MTLGADYNWSAVAYLLNPPYDVGNPEDAAYYGGTGGVMTVFGGGADAECPVLGEAVSSVASAGGTDWTAGAAGV